MAFTGRSFEVVLTAIIMLFFHVQLTRETAGTKVGGLCRDKMLIKETHMEWHLFHCYLLTHEVELFFFF